MGRFLAVRLLGSGSLTLTLCEVKINEKALQLQAFQSGNETEAVAARAFDGNTGNGQWGSLSCTDARGTNPWWAVDLEAATSISSVDLYNRMDCCSGGCSSS